MNKTKITYLIIIPTIVITSIMSTNFLIFWWIIIMKIAIFHKYVFPNDDLSKQW